MFFQSNLDEYFSSSLVQFVAYANTREIKHTKDGVIIIDDDYSNETDEPITYDSTDLMAENAQTEFKTVLHEVISADSEYSAIEDDDNQKPMPNVAGALEPLRFHGISALTFRSPAGVLVSVVAIKIL